jgi:hypothetical protein
MRGKSFRSKIAHLALDHEGTVADARESQQDGLLGFGIGDQRGDHQVVGRYEHSDPDPTFASPRAK